MNDLINIENKILVVRGQQVMLDRDLAEIYGYTTKAFNQQVKNNIEKFPDDMMFRLTKDEIGLCSRSNNLTLNTGRGFNIKYLPYAFTEQGIYMLMTVLKGELATQQSLALVRMFKRMRDFLSANGNVISRLNTIENKMDLKFLEYDDNFSKIFNVMNTSPEPVKQDIFSHGQVFDAYSFFQGLIQSAQKSIILIDNYIDLTVLDRLTKKQKGVNVTIYTQSNTPITKLEISKFNAQYPTLIFKYTKTMHDRFLILDNTDIYHIGASLKDLGRKCFGFTKLDDAARMIQAVMSWV